MTSWSGAACRFLRPALSGEEGFLTDIERLLRSHDGRVTLTDKQFDRVFLIFEKLEALESPPLAGELAEPVARTQALVFRNPHLKEHFSCHGNLPVLLFRMTVPE
jgi:hypothetical protein